MKEYFIAIMTSSVVSAVCVSLASGTQFEKYMRYVCALICASVIVFPLAGVIDISDFKDVPALKAETPESENVIVSAFASESAADYIKNMVCEKFGIIPADVRIEIDIGDDITVEDVTVVLESKDESIRGEVGDFLLSSLGYGIRVVTDE